MSEFRLIAATLDVRHCKPLCIQVQATCTVSVFSKHASLVEILLFDRIEDARPAQVIPSKYCSMRNMSQRRAHEYNSVASLTLGLRLEHFLEVFGVPTRL